LTEEGILPCKSFFGSAGIFMDVEDLLYLYDLV